MRAMAWLYLVAFVLTWVIAGFDPHTEGYEHWRIVALCMLGGAWIIGLCMSVYTLARKESK